MMNMVVIDPGHGGKDPGAVNGNTFEKDIALDIALRLWGLLKGRGYRVMMTRENDSFIPLMERAKKANENNADIFISIHTNSALNKEANGTETLAFDKDERLGVVLHKYMIKDLGLKDRGVKQRKDLAVLNGTKMPAVLVETAFLSNESEKSLLMEAAKREMIAEALLKGVEEYFTGSEKSLEDMKKDVRERFGFDDNTMLYLEMYRYGDELIKRLSEK